jgi:hypothetical protein
MHQLQKSRLNPKVKPGDAAAHVSAHKQDAIMISYVLLSFIHSFLRPTMSSQAVDEETPLSQAQKQKTGRTPLPWRQFSIIMFLQLSEPLTSQVIAPFSPQACACRLPAFTFSSYRLPFKLIRDIGITNGDEIQVGYYVGLLVRLHNLSVHFRSSCQFLTP